MIDAPFDKYGYMSLNRSSEEHRRNVRAVSNYLKSIADVPIWLVGTSRGTDSVANIAISDPEPYAGAVFTSTVQDALYQDTGKISLPTLIVHHSKDGCSVCSPSVAQQLYNSLSQAKSRKLIWVDGGTSQGNQCEGRAFHGFNGIEYKVVNAISDFIIEEIN